MDIACDMTNAPDTGPERVAEYRRLFARALVGRGRTPEGIRFRFRAEDGIETWVRTLAAKEKACCAFFSFTITRAGGEVLWDLTVIDDPAARAVLEEFYNLPDTIDEGTDALMQRFTAHGLRLDPTNAG